jgi:HAD superfamily phosphatase (TIGR01668 family)
MMLRMFFPDEVVDSTYQIDFKKLYEEGIRGIVFDIDNTLVEHGADADERAEKLFEKLKEIGIDACLLSNNKQPRVERFNKNIGVHAIWKAGKPSGKNYFHAMELMHTDLSSTVFIGDQLFTDVWGAKRIGMRNILVRPIGKKEEIQIVLKRYLEKVVLFFYERERKRK